MEATGFSPSLGRPEGRPLRRNEMTEDVQLGYTLKGTQNDGAGKDVFTRVRE